MVVDHEGFLGLSMKKVLVRYKCRRNWNASQSCLSFCRILSCLKVVAVLVYLHEGLQDFYEKSVGYVISVA